MSSGKYSKKSNKSKTKQQSGDLIELYDFDCYGRAEMIRILLHHLNIPFEDNRVEYMKLAEEKKLTNKWDFLEFG